MGGGGIVGRIPSFLTVLLSALILKRLRQVLEAIKAKPKGKAIEDAKEAPTVVHVEKVVLEGSRLKDKVALVTGASTGIGAAVAKAFARQKADVAINYLGQGDLAEAEKVLKEVEAAGRRGLLVQADVSKEADVDKMVSKVTEHFGRIDILVNNAGIVCGAAPVHEMKVEDFDKVMSVNFRSIFLCTRRVLPQMLERNDHGKIINTASQLAAKGAPTFCHYTSSKAATISLTRTVSLEIGDRNVNINAVAPGSTETPILANVPKDVLASIIQSIPKKRMAQVSDIVGAYVYLASSDANSVVGQTISPNGGDQFF